MMRGGFIIILWALACSVVIAPAAAQAATYYVDGARPDDSGDGASWESAKQTISAGIALLAGGDTLLLADGVYSGAANRIADVPGGEPGAYTVVRAQNDWGVTLSANEATPIEIGTQSAPNVSYVEVRGIRITDYEGQKVAVWGDYIKVIRCAADGAGGNAASFCAYGNYILFEECHAWGGPNRYVFRTSHALGEDKGDYVIFRRCVVRWDYSDTTEPISCFANYDTSHTVYQNCMAIDATDHAAQSYEYDGLKGFFTPNGADDTTYHGCIVLNVQGAGYFLEGTPVADITVRDSIAWDVHAVPNRTYTAQLLRARPGDGPMTVEGSLFGVSDLGLGLRMECDNDTMEHSIVYGVSLDDGNHAVYEPIEEDYNCFYGNDDDRNVEAGVGAHSLTDVDPMVSGLDHLVRVEPGSVLAESGRDGAPIGPTILKRVGVSGTLYGEPGWDQVTDEDLWPFPNEAQICDDCRSFHRAPDEAYPGSPEMIGARGFCADGMSLTRYVWEYLGQPMPSDLGGPDEPGADAQDAESSSGCGCRTASSPPSVPWWVALPAALALRRRRRSA